MTEAKIIVLNESRYCLTCASPGIKGHQWIEAEDQDKYKHYFCKAECFAMFLNAQSEAPK